MARRPARITQTDIRTAVAAVTAAGVRVGTVEVLPDGTIRVTAAGKDDAPGPSVAKVREFRL